jgi:hypothetical protein
VTDRLQLLRRSERPLCSVAKEDNGAGEREGGGRRRRRRRRRKRRRRRRRRRRKRTRGQQQGCKGCGRKGAKGGAGGGTEEGHARLAIVVIWISLLCAASPCVYLWLPHSRFHSHSKCSYEIQKCRLRHSSVVVQCLMPERATPRNMPTARNCMRVPLWVVGSPAAEGEGRTY